jgi:hypothetical protein
MQFTWMPYVGDILPPGCTMGTDVYEYMGPIVFLHWVEYHLPHRAIRQRGFTQGIPDGSFLLADADAHRRRHRKLLVTGVARVREMWDARLEHRYVGLVGDRVPNATATTEYLAWYWERTPTFMMDPFGIRPQGYVGSADSSAAAVCFVFMLIPIF